jgi:2-oxoglutarate dehydrogenase E2 component (dihydrolipoamide succinyltransferase)
MTLEIKVPHMGESVSEALISTHFFKDGDYVNKGQEIIELETDKTNYIIYAEVDGLIAYKALVGEKVKTGDCIASISPSIVTVKDKQTLELPCERQKKDIEAIKRKEEKVPFTEKMSSSGFKPDAEVVAAHRKDAMPTSRTKMSHVRSIIAKRMLESKKNKALITTFNEIDLSKVQEVRQTYKEEFFNVHQVRLGMMSFFVKAVVEALKSYPMIKNVIEGNDIIINESFNISIAVAYEKGVITPVLKDADKLSFAHIERKIAEFASFANQGKIKIEDLEGAVFTISNAGAYGSLFSTPIVMPSQSAILGMHNIQKRPVVIDDIIVIRPMMYVALTYDHCLIDGREAIGFLAKIKKEIEDPSRILLEL